MAVSDPVWAGIEIGWVDGDPPAPAALALATRLLRELAPQAPPPDGAGRGYWPTVCLWWQSAAKRSASNPDGVPGKIVTVEVFENEFEVNLDITLPEGRARWGVESYPSDQEGFALIRSDLADLLAEIEAPRAPPWFKVW